MAILKKNSPGGEVSAVREIRKRIFELVGEHLKDCKDITDVYAEDVSTALKWLECELDLSESVEYFDKSSTGLDK